MGRGVGQSSVTLGTDNRVFDLDKAFPPLPPGNIYIGVTGGVESSIVLHLLVERYPNHNIIPCTWKFGDRRYNEYYHAEIICAQVGLASKHVQAGYLKHSAEAVREPDLIDDRFNKENKLFMNFENDPNFVAGFTGKNTTELDPEKIRPEEQEKYLVWYKVHRPLLTYNKHHAVDLYYKVGAEDLLEFTNSCSFARARHCGRCDGCFERIEAFDRLGIRDPAIYDEDFNVLVHRVRRHYHDRARAAATHLL